MPLNLSESSRNHSVRPADGRSLRPPDRLPAGNRLSPLLFLVGVLALAANCTLAQSTSSQSATSTSTVSSSLPITTLSLSGLPALLSLPSLNQTNPTVQLTLPTTDLLYITLNICSLSSNSSIVPTILVSTASAPSWSLDSRVFLDAASGGTSEGGYNLQDRSGSLWQMTLDKGFGNWTWNAEAMGVSMLFGLGLQSDGSTQAVSTEGNVVVQLGVSGSGPLHALTSADPYLGDTTSQTALIFSPLLQSSPHIQPSYPNYTLPPAQLVLPTYSSPQSNFFSNSAFIGNYPNLTLIMTPTGSSPTNEGLDNSLCAIRSANGSTGGVANLANMVINQTEPSWMSVGDEEGFRVFWMVGDLVPSRNYTAWIYDENQRTLSRPIWLATKEANFPCPLVLPNSICPALGYAAPMDLNITSPTSPLISLPETFTSVLTSSLESFSTSLLSQACGRDFFSHISSCADCYSSYRDWLCRVVVPRCASTSSAYPPAATVARTPSNPRNPGLPVPSYDYTELLPCLALCNAADKNCPANMQFRCPERGVTADQSYGYVGGNAAVGDGAEGTGWPPADRWGNRWCNG